MPKRKDFLRNEKILNTRGDQAFYMGAENAKIESAEKSAETGGHLAFGLTNAPGTFQRLMNFVLRGVLGKTCLVYLDDIIVFSRTKEEHFNNLRQIFKLLDEANLKMKLAKCEFLCRSVHY